MGKAKKKMRKNKNNTVTQTSKRSSSSIWLAVLTIMVIGGYTVLLSVNSLNNATDIPEIKTPQTTDEIAAAEKFLEETMVVRDDDFKTGPTDAKVTMIEYSDYQCPACSGFDKNIKEVLAAFPNDIQLIYRDFPLTSIHKNAVAASQAAYAAAKQGKFWEMHDMLFKNQHDWNKLTGTDLTDKFQSYATELGLEMKFFTDDYEKAESSIMDSRAESFNLGLKGTPSLFINGKETKLPSNIESFKLLIQNEIN